MGLASLRSLETRCMAGCRAQGESNIFKSGSFLMIGWNLLFSIPVIGLITSSNSSVIWFSGCKQSRLKNYDGSLTGRVMLLVAEEDVIEQGAVTRQESAC